MPFFKSTPNLPDDEKARIEFHLQQIAECIGFDRLRLPMLSEDAILRRANSTEYSTADQVLSLVGQHLGHDVSGVAIQTAPLPLEKGGGGG